MSENEQVSASDAVELPESVGVPTESAPVALLAPRVTLLVPGAVGMPEMRPLAASTQSPAGRPLALKPVGLLLAVIV